MSRPVEPNGHAVLLLAAGGSRRLGQPKQLLCQAGMPLVRRVAERALTTRPSTFVVVTGAHDEAVRAALTGLPLHRVCNRDWQEGLASSLQCGAAALKDHIGSVLILGCDQIRLRQEHLQGLLQLGQGRSDAIVVTDYGAGRGVPVLLPMSVLHQANGLTGDVGLKALWQRREPLLLAAAELAFDLDTPADLAQAVAAGWLDTPA